MPSLSRHRGLASILPLLSLVLLPVLRPVLAETAPAAGPESVVDLTRKLYRAGNCRAAVALMQQVYQDDPSLDNLFDLARALKTSGELRQAAERFRQYRSDPRASADQQAEADAELRTLSEPSSIRCTDRPPDPIVLGRSGPSPWAYVTAGGALLAVGTGVALYFFAQEQEKQAQDKWDRQAWEAGNELSDRHRNLHLAQWVAWITAVPLAATGTYLFLRDRGAPAVPARSLVWAPGPLGGEWSLTFRTRF